MLEVFILEASSVFNEMFNVKEMLWFKKTLKSKQRFFFETLNQILAAAVGLKSVEFHQGRVIASL